MPLAIVVETGVVLVGLTILLYWKLARLIFFESIKYPWKRTRIELEEDENRATAKIAKVARS